MAIPAKPSWIEGIKYFTPPSGFVLTGRDGMVNIPWAGRPPIPLIDKDFERLAEGGVPDYDMVGSGIYQALRQKPE